MGRKRDDAQGALFDVPAIPGRVRRVRRGVDTTITALRSTGRLEPVDAALIAIARTLADALDDERTDPEGSGFTVATIAGKLTPIVGELRGEHLGGFDPLDELLDGMGADAETST
jgi:hypothetical protein